MPDRDRTQQNEQTGEDKIARAGIYDPPEDARGTWRRYYRKWREVTRERLDPAVLDLVAPLGDFVPPASIFDRAEYSAFSNGELSARLSREAIDTLVISGAETDVCVLSTSLSAVDLGYRVIIAQDALASSSDESHDALLKLYRERFDCQIEVAASAEILDAFGQS